NTGQPIAVQPHVCRKSATEILRENLCLACITGPRQCERGYGLQVRSRCQGERSASLPPRLDQISKLCFPQGGVRLPFGCPSSGSIPNGGVARSEGKLSRLP